MTDIVIAEAVRSAVGRAHKGSLAHTRPDELAGQVIAKLIERAPNVTPDMIEDVVLGCAMPEGEQGYNVARLSGLLAGIPMDASAMTINRFCSSGLQAIAIAAGSVALGTHDIVVAGGVESMTSVPMTGFHLSASPELMEKMPTAFTPMGITAENVAKQFEVSREQQDAFAASSQQKAQAALDYCSARCTGHCDCACGAALQAVDSALGGLAAAPKITAPLDCSFMWMFGSRPTRTCSTSGGVSSILTQVLLTRSETSPTAFVASTETQ